MRGIPKSLHVVVLVMMLFGLLVRPARGADADVGAAATGLASFARAIADLGAPGPLATPLPLTALAPGGPEGLPLGAALAVPLSRLGAPASPAALAAALDGLDGAYGDVLVELHNVVVGRDADGLEVVFSLRAERAVRPALLLEREQLRAAPPATGASAAMSRPPMCSTART